MDGTLMERMERLEQEVERIKSDMVGKPGKRDWQAWCGSSSDDPGFDEMVRLGREYRRQQREAYDRDPDAGA